MTVINQLHTYTIRQIQSRTPLPYDNQLSRKYEYVSAQLPVFDILLGKWSLHGMPELTWEVVNELHAMSPTKRAGKEYGERLRLAKLVLDASRELYHMAAFGRFTTVMYGSAFDYEGQDILLMINGRWVPVQLKMDVFGDDRFEQAKRQRRESRGVTEIDGLYTVRFSGPFDTSHQPWVPEYQCYEQAYELLRSQVPFKGQDSLF